MFKCHSRHCNIHTRIFSSRHYLQAYVMPMFRAATLLLLSKLKGRLLVPPSKKHFRLELFTKYEQDLPVELSAISCIARLDILSHTLHEMPLHMYFVHSAAGSWGGLLIKLVSSNSAASLRSWQRCWAGSSVRVWSAEDVCSASLTKLLISCCICFLLYCLPAGDDLNSDVLPMWKKKM